MLKLTIISLMAAGVALLIASLKPIRIIFIEQRLTHQSFAWKGLGFLIFLFICGYILFIAALLEAEISTFDIVVTFILFSGSCFVFAITCLSLISINEIRKLSMLERYHALHDALTNLPNRTLLNETMINAIANAKRKSTPLAIMLMDLNNFKEVNDTLGHHCGDKLLQLIVPVLTKSIREIDMVARLGGDEFAVILPEADLSDAELIAARIIKTMEQPFVVDQHKLNLGISIGISQYPEDGSDCEILLQKADVAMYIAKKNAFGFSVYDFSKDKNSVTRLTMRSRLHDAILNNELSLHYQPIINLATGKVHALEVLTRWYDKNLGQVPPDEFILLAEQTGIIKQLTLWVVDTAISQLRDWQIYNQDLILSVNFSAKDFQDGNLIRNLLKILSKYELHPNRLNIEITENSMMLESEQPQLLMSKLNELGISISIDDFGTGFSSLAYLKKLTTQSIKIDKSFVMDMLIDTSDEVIVRSIVDIAHNLGQDIVAEGIETQACLDRLVELNCGFGQGYFICKPLPPDEIFVWMQERGEFICSTAN